MSYKEIIRVAIIDMNEGQDNQGMRCIREILRLFGDQYGINIICEEFEVRINHQIPDINHDIFISSGGPGSPLEINSWEELYFSWIEKVQKWNNDPSNIQKKKVFFICHSFQLACRYYNIAKISKRKSTSFGIFPMYLLEDGKKDDVLSGLNNPFYSVDSRDYQVTDPNHLKINEIGASILAIEKERPHIPLERAIMAVRFNENMIGTQFHPEADAVGMILHLQKEDKKKIVIDTHGEKKWESMIECLNDPEKIMWTYSHVLPNFLRNFYFNRFDRRFINPSN